MWEQGLEETAGFRSVTLCHNQNKHLFLSFDVPEKLSEIAKNLINEYMCSGKKGDTFVSIEDVDLSVTSRESQKLLLSIEFLDFSIHFSTNDETENTFLKAFIKFFYRLLCTHFLKEEGGDGIHGKMEELCMDANDRQCCIKVLEEAYYNVALPLLTSQQKQNRNILACDIYPLHYTSQSSLLEALQRGNATGSFIFGGQGVENVFDELKDMYNTYVVCRDFVERMSRVLNDTYTGLEDKTLGIHHTQGYDILSWIKNNNDKKEEDGIVHINECNWCRPLLIGLTQLCSYYTMMKVLCINKPSTITDVMTETGITGHSQGIISAAVVCLSNTMDEFLANSEKAMKLLFWIVVRVQLYYPYYSVTAKDTHEQKLNSSNPTLDVLNESLKHNEGFQTHMLSILGLPIAEIEKLVAEANKQLPTEKKISISLVNNSNAVILSSMPKVFEGLIGNLRDIKAGGVKLKAKYVPVAAPYHSPYGKKVAKHLYEDIKRENLSWSKKCLNIPLWSTAVGKL